MAKVILLKKNKAKKIATWIVVPLMISIFVLDIITVALSNHYQRRYWPEAEQFDGRYGNDRIHFLSTGSSDAILIESCGRFALIDSGEGSDNPRRKNPFEGCEQTVIDYLKKVAADKNGNVFLDFILCTHCHYDHIGAFPAIIADEHISVGNGYIKEYDPMFDTGYETGDWALGKNHDDVVDALIADGASVVSNLPDKEFTFGNFRIKFLNTVNDPSLTGKGENAASVGVLIKKSGRKIFLAADITRTCGLEKLLTDEIGDVDVLKVGHHGYYGSSSISFLKKIKPEICIVTNRLGKVYPNVKWNLTMVAHASVYDTFDNDGVIVSVTDDGEIILTNRIH